MSAFILNIVTILYNVIEQLSPILFIVALYFAVKLSVKSALREFKEEEAIEEKLKSKN